MAEPDVARHRRGHRLWNFTIIGTAIADRSSSSSILNAPLLEYLIHHSASFGRPGAGRHCAFVHFGGIVCGFASVCYAELAAMIPIAAARIPTRMHNGELIAWIIGWDLILEYAVSNMAVSVVFRRTWWACSIGSACIPIHVGFLPRIFRVD